MVGNEIHAVRVLDSIIFGTRAALFSGDIVGFVCCPTVIVDCVCEKGGSLDPPFSIFGGCHLPFEKVDANVAEQSAIELVLEEGLSIFLGSEFVGEVGSAPNTEPDSAT